eukprot:scaffold764_cov79-Skeletonema_menzelii.AAC.12
MYYGVDKQASCSSHGRIFVEIALQQTSQSQEKTTASVSFIHPGRKAGGWRRRKLATATKSATHSGVDRIGRSSPGDL